MLKTHQTGPAKDGSGNIGFSWTFIHVKQYCNLVSGIAEIKVFYNVELLI